MSTQEYPQLQGPAGVGMPPQPQTASYPMHPVFYGPPVQQAPVPPLPPRGRSSGFWVGISTAVTVGFVGVLLIGFFIGRGTRLSNEDVQGKIVEQAQADQISEQQALSSQKAKFTKDEAQAIAAARSNAYSQGQRAGFTAGQQQGFTAGQSQGFNQGQASGIAQGQEAGFGQGLNQGACLANSVFCNGG